MEFSAVSSLSYVIIPEGLREFDADEAELERPCNSGIESPRESGSKFLRIIKSAGYYEMGKLTITERLDKHDREIAAIRKLLLNGMKVLNNLAAAQRELTTAQRELAAAQRETDRQLRETNKQLRAFIQSLRRGGNGHSKRPVL